MAFNVYSRSNPILYLPLARSRPQQASFILVFSAVPGIIIIYCEACSSYLSNDLDVCEGHIKKHHPHLQTAPYVFMCGSCGASFDDKQKVSDHHRLLSKKHICEIRHQSFPGLNYSNNHRAVVDQVSSSREGKRYQCDICGKFIVGLSEFRNHLRSCASEKRFICDICDRRFRRKGMLDYHKTVCKKLDYELICQLCNGTFSNLYRLRQHKAGVHQIPSPEELYQCMRCFKQFTNMFDYRNHMRLCSPTRRSVCNYCKRRFWRKDTLDHHIQNKCPRNPAFQILTPDSSENYSTDSPPEQYRSTSAGSDMKQCDNFRSYHAT